MGVRIRREKGIWGQWSMSSGKTAGQLDSVGIWHWTRGGPMNRVLYWGPDPPHKGHFWENFHPLTSTGHSCLAAKSARLCQMVPTLAYSAISADYVLPQWSCGQRLWLRSLWTPIRVCDSGTIFFIVDDVAFYQMSLISCYTHTHTHMYTHKWFALIILWNAGFTCNKISKGCLWKLRCNDTQEERLLGGNITLFLICSIPMEVFYCLTLC